MARVAQGQRLSIWITPDERDQLVVLARAERRGIREQATYLIARALAREVRKRQRAPSEQRDEAG